MSLTPRAVLAGLLALAWLALAVPGGLGAPELLAALAAAALGGLAAVAWPGIGETIRRTVRAVGEWLVLAPAGAPTGEQGAGGGADGDGGEDVADVVVGDVLEALAEEADARRVVVWRVDRAGDTVVPEHVLGRAPASQRAAGNPLAWAVEEGSGLRLDPAPKWARGEAVAVPVDGRRVLSVEAPPGRAPEPARLEPGARLLASVLTLADRETDARAERRRLARVMDFLQGLSSTAEPGRVPGGLARAAIDLVGARGAAVAVWSGEEGLVLAREGPYGGPGEGMALGGGQGDMVHAARTGATVRRTPSDPGGRSPLAAPDERWDRVPPFRAAIPLRDPDGAASGVVGVWGDSPPSEQGVRVLEALGPLLALQLRQATDLVRFRDRAVLDTLTGLPNRAAFDDRLREEIARFHRHRRPLALLVLDLDHFKAINDSHGHAAGDAVLRAVADRLRNAVRDVDVPARYGGEEMVVLMPDTMVTAARDAAERVRTAIADAPVVHEGTRIPVTVSVGVSGCPERVDDPGALFHSADAALYRAKGAGRNRVTLADRAAAGN